MDINEAKTAVEAAKGRLDDFHETWRVEHVRWLATKKGMDDIEGKVGDLSQADLLRQTNLKREGERIEQRLDTIRAQAAAAETEWQAAQRQLQAAERKGRLTEARTLSEHILEDAETWAAEMLERLKGLHSLSAKVGGGLASARVDVVREAVRLIQSAAKARHRARTISPTLGVPQEPDPVRGFGLGRLVNGDPSETAATWSTIVEDGEAWRQAQVAERHRQNDAFYAETHRPPAVVNANQEIAEDS